MLEPPADALDLGQGRGRADRVPLPRGLAPGRAPGVAPDLELDLEELLARLLGCGGAADRSRQPGLARLRLGPRLRLGGLRRLHAGLLLLARPLLGGLLLGTVEHPGLLPESWPPQPNRRDLAHGSPRGGSLDSRFDPLPPID